MAQMKPEVREQLQRVIDHEILEPLAGCVIADAGKDFDASHRAFLTALSTVVEAERDSDEKVKQAARDARRDMSAAHRDLIRDLNMILAAEAAVRLAGEAPENYRGVEIVPVALGLVSMSGAAAGCLRFKSTVGAATLVSCTREGIRSMIDEETLGLSRRLRSPWRKAGLNDKVRALVVDDDLDTLNTTCQLLEHSCACEVRGCGDAIASMAMAEAFRPHLVLLDIRMPGANGIEVAEMLHAEHIWPPLVVAVTGYGDAKARHETASAGFDYHELKPISVARLRELVAEAARRSRDKLSL
jgi:CheY-like chemotaxis protein